MKSYRQLEEIFKKIDDIEGAKSVLYWDSAVTMPAGGMESRADQLATLGAIANAILGDEAVGDLLSDAESRQKSLNDWQKANLREMRRQWKHAVAIDSSLLQRLTKAGVECEHMWRTAREANDFKSYQPYQQKVLDLVREVAKAKSEQFNCSPYEALMDQYDPGRTEKELDQIFGDLEEFLPDFIKEVVAHQKKQPKLSPLKGTFDKDKQKELGLKLMEDLGFDFNHGRLDESHHPFCGGGRDDVRITTRYDEKNFIPSLMGVLHETGHALYERGLPEKWVYQPVGKARGMTIHESQSLLVEMQVCRSKEFLSYALPLIRDTFKLKGKTWDIENVYGHYNKVKPSLIRVDADEVTYPCHVMIRYRLEQFMINGELDIEELPEAWKQGMKKFLGVTPKDDKDGCMQDVHWTDGSFGYFPTYTLGAMSAAQFFAAMKADNDKLPKLIEKGNFKDIRKWLGKNVHEVGSKLSTNEILKAATGEELNVKAFKEHLKNRYLG